MHVTPRETAHGPRVLGVVAHPDDETAFAAALYKITTYLDGACDLAVITDGEAGFKYATLAERVYGLELTDESVGRAHLPDIRKRELGESASILGVRDLFFLEQKDHRYTTDIDEVLGVEAHVWDIAFVRERLRDILERGRYDFVFTLAPTADTHAHHKAATILALEVAESLPLRTRPVVLCARTVKVDETKALETLGELPIAALARDVVPFEFDRRQAFGHKQSLDYRIVVNWVIAAHISQGTMQLAMNEGDREQYFLFAHEPENAGARARKLFDALRGDQFAPKTYASSAGTNAGQ